MNVVPKTPTNTIPGLTISRAPWPKIETAKWIGTVRCDEHLKNQRGMLALTPRAAHLRLAHSIRAGSGERSATLFHAAKGPAIRTSCPSACAGTLKPSATSRSIAPTKNFLLESQQMGGSTEIHLTMSAAATNCARARANRRNPPLPSRIWLGSGPYLKRYPGGIALGLITLVGMSLIGNVIPLGTGVITDVIAGSATTVRNPVDKDGAPAMAPG